MCVRAILLLVDPINCSVRSANKGGAQAPRAPPLATPLVCTQFICILTTHSELHSEVHSEVHFYYVLAL